MRHKDWTRRNEGFFQEIRGFLANRFIPGLTRQYFSSWSSQLLSSMYPYLDLDKLLQSLKGSLTHTEIVSCFWCPSSLLEKELCSAPPPSKEMSVCINHLSLCFFNISLVLSIQEINPLCVCKRKSFGNFVCPICWLGIPGPLVLRLYFAHFYREMWKGL